MKSACIDAVSIGLFVAFLQQLDEQIKINL